MILRSWKDFYDSQPIMIPFNIENSFNNIYNEANAIFNDYIEGKRKYDAINEFKLKINDMEKLKKIIETYVNENRNDKFSVTKDMENWLLKKVANEKMKGFDGRNYYHRLFRYIKKTGKINIKTYAYIHEENYIRRLLSDIRQHVEAAQLVIKEINFERSIFVLEYIQTPNILMSCRITDMLTFFAEAIFKRKDYFINYDKLLYDIVNKCRIEDDASIEFAISILDRRFRNKELSIEWYGIKSNKVEIKYQNKGYLTFGLFDIINIHKNFLLFNQDTSFIQLIDRFKNGRLKPIDQLKSEIADYQSIENGRM
ncbi:MAG: hypothetical protein QJR05_05875 [Thermoanaerobacterium sp.]|nr:hypothetical protein [Thermoanaerobacterium sp.]